MDFKKLLKEFEQPQEPVSGGIHIAPETRLLLVILAKLINAEDVLELGYDAGYTAKALCESGVNYVGVDNLSEYGEVDEDAKKMLKGYKNCKLINTDAIGFLRKQKDDEFDLIFVDDKHEIVHVRDELIEVKRVLRSGGIVVVAASENEGVKNSVLDTLREWQRLFLPSYSPVNGSNVGIVVLRKP